MTSRFEEMRIAYLDWAARDTDWDMRGRMVPGRFVGQFAEFLGVPEMRARGTEDVPPQRYVGLYKKSDDEDATEYVDVVPDEAASQTREGFWFFTVGVLIDEAPHSVAYLKLFSPCEFGQREGKAFVRLPLDGSKEFSVDLNAPRPFTAVFERMAAIIMDMLRGPIPPAPKGQIGFVMRSAAP